MTTMDDVLAFVRARLDDKELAARAAGDAEGTGPIWKARPGGLVVTDGGYLGDDTVEGATSFPEPVAEYLAAHDPFQALAEVDTTRKILRQCEQMADAGVERWPERIVRTFALSYVGHPDYREEWRP